MHMKRYLARIIAVGVAAAMVAPATAVAVSGSTASAGGPTQISGTKLFGRHDYANAEALLGAGGNHRK